MPHALRRQASNRPAGHVSIMIFHPAALCGISRTGFNGGLPRGNPRGRTRVCRPAIAGTAGRRPRKAGNTPAGRKRPMGNTCDGTAGRQCHVTAARIRPCASGPLPPSPGHLAPAGAGAVPTCRRHAPMRGHCSPAVLAVGRKTRHGRIRKTLDVTNVGSHEASGRIVPRRRPITPRNNPSRSPRLWSCSCSLQAAVQARIIGVKAGGAGHVCLRVCQNRIGNRSRYRAGYALPAPSRTARLI